MAALVDRVEPHRLTGLLDPEELADLRGTADVLLVGLDCGEADNTAVDDDHWNRLTVERHGNQQARTQRGQVLAVLAPN